MGYKTRNCDNCKKEYQADTRNLKRGWGLCCSKSCAAKKREKSRPNYDPKIVAANNYKRKGGEEGFAKRRGFPSFAEMEDSQALDDPSWDGHGGIEIAMCDYCNMRSDYCECDRY